MRRHCVALLAALSIAIAAGGCSAASYEERMKFLDKMSAEGLKYRSQLQEQNTNPDAAACEIGWNLLSANIPSDITGAGPSSTWQAQVKEAYVKSCMTGETIPKPDPSGINARTPVPFSHSPAATPS